MDELSKFITRVVVMLLSIILLSAKTYSQISSTEKILPSIRDTIFLKVDLDISYTPIAREKSANINFVVINASDYPLIFNTLAVYGEGDFSFFSPEISEEHQKVRDRCAFNICGCEEYDRKKLSRKDSLASIVTIKPYDTYTSKLNIHFCFGEGIGQANYWGVGLIENIKIRLIYDNTKDNNPYLYDVKKVWKGKLVSNEATF
jgi:hypothetical protein